MFQVNYRILEDGNGCQLKKNGAHEDLTGVSEAWEWTVVDLVRLQNTTCLKGTKIFELGTKIQPSSQAASEYEQCKRMYQGFVNPKVIS